MYVESDASVRTQMSHVVVEIKNTKLVVARLAGTDANVWSKAKCHGNMGFGGPLSKTTKTHSNNVCWIVCICYNFFSKKNVVLEQNLGSNQIVDPLKICNSFKPTLAPDSEPFVASLEEWHLVELGTHSPTLRKHWFQGLGTASSWN